MFMRLLITLVFLAIALFSYSQEPKKSNDIPELVKKFNICEQISFSRGPHSKKYLSRKIIYDSLGRSISQIDSEEDNSNDSRITSYYFGDTLEIDIYIDSTNIDTAKYIYKNKILEAEYWYSGEDQRWGDSTFYFYDSTGKLIVKIDTYSGRRFDSLKYKNNNLIQETTFDQNNEIAKQIIYRYSNNLVISKIESGKYLKSDSTFYTYNKKSQLRSKKGRIYRSFYTISYSYHNNGFIKKRKYLGPDKNGNIDKTIILYDRNGFPKKMKSFTDGKKNSTTKTIYLKCANHVQ